MMTGTLLDAIQTAQWVVQDFWLSASLAVALASLRALRTPLSRESRGFCSPRWSHLTNEWWDRESSIPLLVWALEANSMTRLVAATHASTSAPMLLASGQEFLGALALLVAIVALDLVGKQLECHRSGQHLKGLPHLPMIACATVIADWLLCQVGWWLQLLGPAGHGAP